jgi:pimeloyl-ACP methyl ester carboxylesterase
MRRWLFTGGLITALAGLGAPGLPAAQAQDQAGAGRLSDAATGAAPSGAEAPIAWRECPEPDYQAAGFECGFLTVPLDHARPGGPTVRLAVTRHRHTAPAAEFQGVVIANPGGPGSSGRYLAGMGGWLPAEVGAAYDWVGFDPRGVGASEPTLSCDSGYFAAGRPPYVPDRLGVEADWRARTSRYAAACAATGSPLWGHLRTTDTAADLESLRKALGQRQITYYGFSYGTYLGQVYDTLYPGRLRRMVLDGVKDPDRLGYAAGQDQERGFDVTVKAFFAWIADHDDVYHLGTTARAVEGRYYRVLADLTDHPRLDGQLGATEWTDTFIGPAYGVYGWAWVAGLFSAAVNDGAWSPVLDNWYSFTSTAPGADAGYAARLGQVCTDSPWPRSWPVWRSATWRVYRAAPYNAWSNTWYDAPCRVWPVAAGPRVAVRGSSTPVLLINETLDAATPFSGALTVRRRFPRAVLVEGVGGTTHSGSFSGVGCVDGTVAAFLGDGVLPPRTSGDHADKPCPPVPAPEPATGALARAAAGASGPAGTAGAGVMRAAGPWVRPGARRAGG